VSARGIEFARGAESKVDRSGVESEAARGIEFARGAESDCCGIQSESAQGIEFARGAESESDRRDVESYSG